ncbi:ring-1,2-phenylacetyl-CoA epoxidase subunit PaaA [Stigmatella erecta]|uniref:Ring-1,2-phenylacetyl-CoA epoxidase subunit PaaA n=1 Tax=Stigmatella erecta TaxID=83460 RepID=A0A1I0KW99_9BACT|nr:1,2-phenylacetyl-CoA epoxidase subunit PaaA [Stigmatella erecta]SEU30452.1 ring-1,2-phenylacetyl-CoA epoxidase subunit PaaA [Stigmatella erecta]
MAGTVRSEQEFIAHVQSGGVIEAGDWMPEGYRRAVIRFIEMHANSEYMGALLERDWIARAPTLERRIGITSKVQDEVGHAQHLYCLLEDLGRPRAEVLSDLLEGRSRYNSFFHYPTASWADVGIIAWLSDAASIIAQKALLQTSYGPYRRILPKICWEEAFHVVHGREIMRTLVSGTREQRDMAQEALTRWWPRLIYFHGPPTPAERDADLTVWKLKGRLNEDMRQEFLRLYIPKIHKWGLQLPDPQLAFDEASQRWRYTPADWEQVRLIGRGQGPASQAQLEIRRRAMEDNRWVAETLAPTPAVQEASR